MRNWKQRLCSLLLCGAMLASLCTTALAKDVSIPYLDEKGEGRSCEKYTAVSEYGEWWENDWYVAQGSIEIPHPIAVIGEVHLILANGCYLKVNGDINVGGGSSLTIYAQSKDESDMGKLEAHGGDTDAGIGGGYGGSGGSITISGGTVTATSKGKGADIGGGGNSAGGGIAPSEKIEIGEGANVKGSGGGKPNLGPPHGAETDKWDYDSTGHWHPCEVESCAEQFDKAAHSYGNEWKSDADRHWHECSCGDKSDEAAHSFSDWTIDTPATAATAGSKHQDCGICQYRETETIPATGGGGGYVPPTYRPDVTQPSQGGSVSVSPSSPQRGDTVTVTPRPDEGYALDSITVTDRDGKGVELTAGPDGTYTFRQPSGRVKIEVAFKPIESPWNNPFSDVSQDDWYYEAVRFAQEQGLMNGYSDGRFGAEDTLSRSQLAQILFNKEGRPGVNYLPDFSDMAGGAWYTEAVRWAASQGIVGGYGDGTFGPNAPITREQLAVMLWRYSGSPAAAGTELDFNDAGQISGYALEALRWAVESGVLNGDGGGRLDPQVLATRAQVAQILKNFLEEENT